MLNIPKNIYEVDFIPNYFVEVSTKFLGDSLQSNSAFNEGINPFSERKRNLSNKMHVSTNGASISRSELKSNTLLDFVKNSQTFDCVK